MDGLQHPMVSYVLNFCARSLNNYGLSFNPGNVSASKVVEVVNFASRDLARISHDLKKSVSRQKYAGYYGFWFAKLAPISGIRRTNGYSAPIEVVDINERIAIELSIDLLLNSIGVPEIPSDIIELTDDDALRIGASEAPVPLVWKTCEKACAGECFKTGIRKFLEFHEYQNFEYLVNSLRHRGVGPYQIVAILEAVVINSCEGRDPFAARL